MPIAIFLAGPNGAGKSTMLPQLPLPEGVELVLADELATGYRAAGAGPLVADIRAGRAVVRRMRELEDTGTSFLHETNLPSPRRFRRLRKRGFQVRLIFVGLRDPEIAVARVAKRVRDGGHDVPEETIRGRWAAGIGLLLRRCPDVVDDWALYDSQDGIVAVAHGSHQQVDVEDYPLWREYRRLADELDPDWRTFGE